MSTTYEEFVRGITTCETGVAAPVAPILSFFRQGLAGGDQIHSLGSTLWGHLPMALGGLALGVVLSLAAAATIFPKKVSKLSFRTRLAIYFCAIAASLLAVLVRYCTRAFWLSYGRLVFLGVCLAALGLAAYYALTMGHVVVRLVRTVRAPEARNTIDSNFLQADDEIVEAYVRYGGVWRHLLRANLDLAHRAAASCIDVSADQLDRYIARDRSFGRARWREESHEDTLHLAMAFRLRRLEQTRDSSSGAECHVLRPSELLWILKSQGLTYLPPVIFGLLHPVLTAPMFLIRSVLFGGYGEWFVNAIKEYRDKCRKFFRPAFLDHIRIKAPEKGQVRSFVEDVETAIRSVYQVGPILRCPHYFTTSGLTLARSLIYRSARKTPDPSPWGLEYYKQAVKTVVSEVFPEGFTLELPVDLRQMVLESHFDARKTRNYMRVIDSCLGSPEDSLLLPEKAQAFIKAETYPDFTKEPRTIQFLQVFCRIMCMYWFKCLNEHFFRSAFSVKHVPANERPKALSDRFQGAGAVFGWDCSGFEASVSYDMEKILWQEIADRFHLPQFMVDWVCFKQTRLSGKGATYCGPHSRRSGDYWTSLSNSLVNLSIQYAVAAMCGESVSRIVVEGDDCIVAYSGYINRDKARQAFRELGFEAKDPDVGGYPGEVAFCSTKYDRYRQEPTRDPRNLVDNVGVSFSPSAAKDPAFALGQRAMSYSVDCPRSPITWVLHNIAVKQGIKPEDLEWWYRLRAESCDSDEISPPPSQAAREEFDRLWDCPIDVQLEIERCLLHGINFAESSKIIDWRDKDRPDMQAILDGGDPYPSPDRIPLRRFDYMFKPRKVNKSKETAERGDRLARIKPMVVRLVQLLF